MIRQEIIVFYRPEDAVNHAKETLGDPTIVVLPFQALPASVSSSIDDLELVSVWPITLSAEVIHIEGERLALLSLGENCEPGPVQRKIAFHKVSPERAAGIIQDGLMLAIGRFGLHENERNIYDDDYGGRQEFTITLAVSTEPVKLETSKRRELSPAFGQPVHRLPVTDGDIDLLTQLIGGYHIPLNQGEDAYREALREQTLALFNLAGLLVRVPPEFIDFETSLRANRGQKRSELEKLLAAAN